MLVDGALSTVLYLLTEAVSVKEVMALERLAWLECAFLADVPRHLF